ncbi:hypothetical protein B0H14DRAFT_2623000 [Mycena olivaceomarginata]|nr:hypothetical protein B0H14DRAFT_2623000 [Mycena olivaceomarginata]
MHTQDPANSGGIMLGSGGAFPEVRLVTGKKNWGQFQSDNELASSSSTARGRGFNSLKAKLRILPAWRPEGDIAVARPTTGGYSSLSTSHSFTRAASIITVYHDAMSGLHGLHLGLPTESIELLEAKLYDPPSPFTGMASHRSKGEVFEAEFFRNNPWNKKSREKKLPPIFAQMKRDEAGKSVDPVGPGSVSVESIVLPGNDAEPARVTGANIPAMTEPQNDEGKQKCRPQFTTSG